MEVKEHKFCNVIDNVCAEDVRDFYAVSNDEKLTSSKTAKLRAGFHMFFCKTAKLRALQRMFL